MVNKFAAEFVGTLVLVLFGCGAAVLGGEHVGQLGIALAFGFAMVFLGTLDLGLGLGDGLLDFFEGEGGFAGVEKHHA